MSEEIIETLLAEKGLKYDETGEAIASYVRSIVFLPKGAVPGQNVRVILQEIPGKTDRRGRSMYEGIPGPVEYSERWKDNGDGTASRVKIAKDWLLQESEVEVIEIRKLETREATPTTRSTYQMIWGQDLATSIVEDRQVRSIPLEEEKVEGDRLVWRKAGDRQEPLSVVDYLISEVVVQTCEWYRNRLQVTYDSRWSVDLTFFFEKDGSQTSWHPSPSTWAEMPTWWRQEQEFRYPVCSCGRQRRDAQVADGYAKCEPCRSEEICERCGKQAKVSVVNGHLVCDACRSYAEAEQLIAVHLTDVHRQAIVDEAKKLLAGQALEGELGLAVLKVGLGHVSSDYTRGRISNRWSGYQYYYFTDGGIFGTKLSAAALSILEFLPQAIGNGLVEMVAWLAEGPMANHSDYYLLTQVQGKDVKHHLTEDLIKQVADKVEAGEPVLADWLRGSEADRIAVLEAFHKAEAELDGDEFGKYYVDKARQVLQSEEQNYKLVLEKIAKAFAEHDRQEVLNDLLAQEYASCPVCGEELSLEDRRDSHYCQKQDELRAKGQYQTFVVKDSCVGEVALVSLVAVCDGHYNEYELRLEVNRNAVVDDPDAVKTTNYWREPSARERELTEELTEVEARISFLEGAQANYEENLRRAQEELTWQEAEASEGRSPTLRQYFVVDGVVFAQKEYKGQPQMQAGVKLLVCCEECGQNHEKFVKLVANPHEVQPPAGVPVIGRLSSVVMYRHCEAEGWWFNPVLPPLDTTGELAELQNQKVRLEKELVAQAVKVDAFDDEGNPQTAMAAAMQEAGLV